MPGNRRSVDNPEGAGSAAEDSTVRIAPAEPQKATQGLQFAGFTPIQPLPSIKQVTTQTQVLVQQVQQPQQQQPQQDTVVTQNVAPSSAESNEVETQTPVSPLPETENAEPQPEETFETCWQKMVDVIFQKKPAFYHQLKDYLPRYENDVIYVDVENDFQKNQLEMSKRAMLEYWRNQFRLNVNEIEFVIHEHEKKKVIYTSEDKVNNMLEQNPELKDFLQVLNFRIKD